MFGRCHIIAYHWCTVFLFCACVVFACVVSCVKLLKACCIFVDLFACLLVCLLACWWVCLFNPETWPRQLRHQLTAMLRQLNCFCLFGTHRFKAMPNFGTKFSSGTRFFRLCFWGGGVSRFRLSQPNDVRRRFAVGSEHHRYRMGAELGQGDATGAYKPSAVYLPAATCTAWRSPRRKLKLEVDLS